MVCYGEGVFGVFGVLGAYFNEGSESVDHDRGAIAAGAGLDDDSVFDK